MTSHKIARRRRKLSLLISLMLIFLSACAQAQDGTSEVTQQTPTTSEAQEEQASPQETVKPEQEAQPPPGEEPAEEDAAPAPPKAEPKPQEEKQPEAAALTCDQFGLLSGQFVEDGTDQPVENVAAVLVTNRTDRFLDFASLSFEIDGQEAVFTVSGLPAGRSAWVLEAERLTGTAGSVFSYQDMVTSFRDDVSVETDELTIQPGEQSLTVTNVSQKRIQDVFVCYKNLHGDGVFFGGIAYRVDFGTLEPGASVTKTAGHFSTERSEIVRVGWRD